MCVSPGSVLSSDLSYSVMQGNDRLQVEVSLVRSERAGLVLKEDARDIFRKYQCLLLIAANVSDL